MSKLLINTNGLKSYFMPVIDDGIDELISAINIAEGLDIPSGFSYRTYLNALPEAIRKVKGNCVLIKDYVNTSIVEMNNTSLEVCDLFDKIDATVIKERIQIIK